MGRVFLLAGVAAVGVWVVSQAIPAIWQDWDNWVFDREVRGETAAPTEYLSETRDRIVGDVSAWWNGVRSAIDPEHRADQGQVEPGQPNKGPSNESVKTDSVIGRLTIPRLHVTTMVREGVRETTLSLAAGHIPSTALPGEPGNVGVAGHRDTLFRGLKGIRDSDLIQFETLSGSYVYQVESTTIVKPKDVGVLRPGPYSELTLVTCYPFNYIGSAPDRFIVKARQVLESPLKPDLSTTKSPPNTTSRQEGAPGAEGEGHTLSGSRVSFVLSENHSRQLAPGISIGVTNTDAADGTVSGWIWVMPDRRTVWMRNQPVHDPVVFSQDGKSRELLVTGVTGKSVTGYLLLPEKEER